MREQTKRYLQMCLCGVLIMAMITACSTAPDTQTDMQAEEAEAITSGAEVEADTQTEETEAIASGSEVRADINVEKVELPDDFITGADLSSYLALRESGVEFKDDEGNPLSDEGFFAYLYEGGTNWVRIRIWNDPYDKNGRGYGGGNNDLKRAIAIGKLATDAGMRVLIDFHYSDFWADPSKQQAPKAWAEYDIAQKEDALYKFTLDSLNALGDAGVDVGMVQVGNETNNGMSGETKWDDVARLLSAGSRAVREFDENCLVAVHFTDPQKGYGTIASRLDTSGVDYDVFASSFYPFWHGDTANLQAELTNIVEKYGKKVMAVETSWPTTLVDGDGYGNVTLAAVPQGYTGTDYKISVQGQADEMRDLVDAVNKINDTYAGSSIGVCYWEPAWISPYYIKDEEGNDIDSLYDQNFALWEEYGSGWASSYAGEYDPDDAGVWYGGSAMDNSSWFDFDGTALPTAKVYSLIRTGAVADPETTGGEELTWSGVTAAGNSDNGEGSKAQSVDNIIENPNFEDGAYDPWVVDTREGHGEAASTPAVWVNGEDPHSGSKGLHFWSVIGLDFTVSQTVTPEAGTYTFGAYIQGGDAAREDVQHAFVKVFAEDGTLKSTQEAEFTLDGWLNWSNPEITDISVGAGDYMEVGLIVTSTKDGAWGTMDDFYLSRSSDQ